MNSLRIFNPATGARITDVPADTPASVAAKCAAARAAQPAWAARPMAERVRAIRRYGQLLTEQLDTLAATLTQEVGKPISQSRNEIKGLQPRIDFFVEQAEPTLRDEHVFDGGGMHEQISHIPLGVVANISAWNYPYFVGNNVIVPALLAGNAVLYKPSEFATLTGQHIVRLLHEAGVPEEVMVAVVGGGDVGTALLAQPIDGVFFTGSHATGVRIAQAVAGRPIKVQLELGGKDPMYVRADADAKAAAQSLADGAMYNTGQGCCSVERIYVHEHVHDAFVEHLLAAVDSFKSGEVGDDATYVGAITRPAQLDVLDAQVADAKAKGAHVLRGGRRGEGPGWHYAPTVITDANHTMSVMRDESFGPIVGIQKVRDDDEAIKLMNDTRYGLTAGVYTRDEAKARELMAQLNAGTVYWNCCDRVSPRLPWSGQGDSGVGLTLSTHGILAFTRPKAWHLRSP